MRVTRVQGKRWLFLGLVGVAVLAFVIIGRVLSREATLRSDLPPTVAGGQTASQAHAILESWASEWNSDAGVVNCATTQRVGQLEDGGWSFQVYSPSKQKIAVVRVHAQEVSVLHEAAALYPQTTLPTAAWETGSSEVLQRWWESGGREVWQQPGAESLNMRLGTNADAMPTWEITVSQRENALAYWEIAAGTNQVLQRNGVGEP